MEVLTLERRKQKDLISVRVTNKFKNEYNKIAEEKDMTLPDLVRYILTDYKEKHRKEKINEENQSN